LTSQPFKVLFANNQSLLLSGVDRVLVHCRENVLGTVSNEHWLHSVTYQNYSAAAISISMQPSQKGGSTSALFVWLLLLALDFTESRVYGLRTSLSAMNRH
jgi:hypothetical protein